MHILTRPVVPVRFGADSSQSRPTSSHRAAHEVEAGPSASRPSDKEQEIRRLQARASAPLGEVFTEEPSAPTLDEFERQTRSNSFSQVPQRSPMINPEENAPPPYSYSGNGEDRFQRQAPVERPELPAESVERHELSADSVERHELPAERVERHELPAGRVERYELPGERGSTESSNAQTSNQDVEANDPNQRPEQSWAKKNWKKLAAVSGTLLAGAIVAGPVGAKFANTNKNDSTPDSPSTTTDPTTSAPQAAVTCRLVDTTHAKCESPETEFTWQDEVCEARPSKIPLTGNPENMPKYDFNLVNCKDLYSTYIPESRLWHGTLFLPQTTTRSSIRTTSTSDRITEGGDPGPGIGIGESKKEERRADAHEKPTRTTSPKPIITGKRPEKKEKLEDQD